MEGPHPIVVKADSCLPGLSKHLYLARDFKKKIDSCLDWLLCLYKSNKKIVLVYGSKVESGLCSFNLIARGLYGEKLDDPWCKSKSVHRVRRPPSSGSIARGTDQKGN
jgi:hypothetical protein